MLGKLIKHEFAATARIMWPIFAGAAVVSLLANFSIRLLDVQGSNSRGLLTVLATLVVMAFVLALVAVCVMSLVIMIQRFRQNLLGDEGYLMFTLPVSVHELVWAKLIVSTVWFIASALMVVLCMVLLVFRVEYIGEFFGQFRQLLQEISRNVTINWVAYGLEMLAAVLVGSLQTCLMFYAAMSLGHSFTRRKMLCSVLFFLGFLFVAQLLAAVFTVNIGYRLTITQMQQVLNAAHITLLSGIGFGLVLSAVFYLITTLSLKKRLNLE